MICDPIPSPGPSLSNFLPTVWLTKTLCFGFVFLWPLFFGPPEGTQFLALFPPSLGASTVPGFFSVSCVQFFQIFCCPPFGLFYLFPSWPEVFFPVFPDQTRLWIFPLLLPFCFLHSCSVTFATSCQLPPFSSSPSSRRFESLLSLIPPHPPPTIFFCMPTPTPRFPIFFFFR